MARSPGRSEAAVELSGQIGDRCSRVTFAQLDTSMKQTTDSTSTRLSRRDVLKTAAGASATLAFLRPARATQPAANVEETRIISWEPDKFHGWPTLARRASGELLLAYSGGRQEHSCPFGRLELMRSRDEGRTWTWPQVIYDGPIDDRDGGILETSKGSLLITTFTNDGGRAELAEAEKLPAGH